MMDSSRKATDAGKQRMVARLSVCSSSPACSVRAPWGRGSTQPGPTPWTGVSLGEAAGPGCRPPRRATHSGRLAPAPGPGL